MEQTQLGVITPKWTKRDAAGTEGQEGIAEKIDVFYDIVIKAILYTDHGRSVAIENDILYEGDSIFGATILKIKPNSVEFEKNGVQFTKTFHH